MVDEVKFKAFLCERGFSEKESLSQLEELSNVVYKEANLLDVKEDDIQIALQEIKDSQLYIDKNLQSKGAFGRAFFQLQEFYNVIPGKNTTNAEDSILVTTSFDFQGYTIVEYLGYIQAEGGFGLGFIKSNLASIANVVGEESLSIGKKIREAKNAILPRLKKEALNYGADAIIGIDIDYTMFGGSVIAVIASGTAVKISQNRDEKFVNQ
ncbi:hypothetical protein FACS1894125_5770 [Actinomycetota bacterium]|nr:hypothetical protein FACS1894125_5770 [Actinomycetota bacterium]